MDPVPLQVINDYLLDKNVGQALVILFAFAVLAVLPLKSRKVLSLTIGLFGAIFALAPISATGVYYRLFGLVLVVVAPVLYLTATE